MVSNKNISVIIQARFGSTRFPGKILSKIKDKTLLEILIKRLLLSKKISNIFVACTKNKKDDQIIKICNKLKIKTFRGSERNVLSRYYNTANLNNVQNIVRITSDCPLIDPIILDKFIDKFFSENFDYLSNIIEPTYPDGMDIEIFKFKVLKERYLKKISKLEQEHVTIGIKKIRKYKKFNFKLLKDYSKLRLTIDTKEDFIFLKKLLKKFNNNFKISFSEIIQFYEKNKFFFNTKKFVRNDGMTMNLGQKYWSRANEVIPGGTMLFSKNPDLHLPKLWPAYYSKAKGCNIWDLEKNKFKDIFLMGVGTNSLGYAYKPLEAKIVETLKKGNMSSLNSIEEILLAEELLTIHNWADLVKFTRSGGEANSVAIRIARAASGRDNVAICGYHGWHDWYLASNLQNRKNLNSHLMKNLSIKGVPRVLNNTVFPFEYNNINQLKKIIDKKNIGVVKMEVQRNVVPKKNFLKEVREICDKKKIVLIFDECTSGFRSCYGGLHLKYKINPDISIFGKALGNGHAINAIIGKKEIMENIKDTFISSTFWTERLGSVAGLETLKLMKKIESWKINSKIGANIKKNWNQIARENSLRINIQGIDSLPNFIFNSNKHNLYKTYISQQMIKKKIMASNVVYTCISHTNKILDNYFDNLNDIFKMIKKCEDEQENIYNLLKTNEAITGIRSN
jgi:glutamate-1-semialdehyde 2,1-aminomutase